MIKITEKRMKKLIDAWYGHILNETICNSCPTANCPIHNFFVEMKTKLNYKVGISKVVQKGLK